MRKFLIALMTLLLMSSVWVRSQNVMTAHLKNGGVVDFAFSDKPVVTFTDSEVVFTTTVDGRSVVVKYETAALSKFTFATKDLTEPENPDAVERIEKDRIKILIDDYTVTVTGAKADQVVRLITAGGSVAGSYKTDKDGSVYFSIADVPVGTYIITCQDISFKILKQ